MYIDDGKDFDYAGIDKHCFSFGWLSSDHEYTVGWNSEEEKSSFLEKLLTLDVVDKYRGWHTDSGLKLENTTRPYPNGSLKFKVGGITYVAPVAVIHFIRHLDYRPPSQVVEALNIFIGN